MRKKIQAEARRVLFIKQVFQMRWSWKMNVWNVILVWKSSSVLNYTINPLKSGSFQRKYLASLTSKVCGVPFWDEWDAYMHVSEQIRKCCLALKHKLAKTTPAEHGESRCLNLPANCPGAAHCRAFLLWCEVGGKLRGRFAQTFELFFLIIITRMLCIVDCIFAKTKAEALNLRLKFMHRLLRRVLAAQED